MLCLNALVLVFTKEWQSAFLSLLSAEPDMSPQRALLNAAQSLRRSGLLKWSEEASSFPQQALSTCAAPVLPRRAYSLAAVAPEWLDDDVSEVNLEAQPPPRRRLTSLRRLLPPVGPPTSSAPSHHASWVLPPVTLATTPDEIEEAAAALLCDSIEAGCPLLGFDIEYRPNFSAGSPQNRTALLQFASARRVVLARVAGATQLPPSCQELFSSPAIWLVGVGVATDCQKVARDFCLDVENTPPSFVDVATAAALYRHTRLGLSSLAEAHGLRMSKAMQLSDWAAATLCAEQVEYAANDAHVGLWLLHRLHALHGAGEGLGDWAAALRGCASLTHLLRAHSPGAVLPRAMASALEARRAEAEAAAALRADARAEAKERKRCAIREGLAV